jgi:hypothetical protein
MMRRTRAVVYATDSQNKRNTAYGLSIPPYAIK